MKNFDAAVLRLKGQVGMTEDQAVASLLGLSKASFSDRKRRDSFPEDKLRALAHQRPELNIDVDYVITGVAQAALDVINAVREGRPYVKVGPEDQQLLAHWHRCAASDQRLLLLMLKRLSADASSVLPFSEPAPASPTAPSKQVNKAAGSVMVGVQTGGTNTTTNTTTKGKKK